MPKPKQYRIDGEFLITENRKERTHSIYTRDGKFLSTVDDGELHAELDSLRKERNE